MSFWRLRLDQNTNQKFDNFCPERARAETIKIFVGILVQMMISLRYFEINWPLNCSNALLDNFTFQNRCVKWRVNLICTWMATNILAGVGWFYPLKGLKFVSFRLSTRWEVRSLAPQWPFFLDIVQKLWGFFAFKFIKLLFRSWFLLFANLEQEAAW